jgi:hypothetical protein
VPQVNHLQELYQDAQSTEHKILIDDLGQPIHPMFKVQKPNKKEKKIFGLSGRDIG